MEAEKHESSSICTRTSECDYGQPISDVLLRNDKTTILDEIMKDLTEPNMIIFGVYGSSISKINLVEQTKKRVERDGLFDAVLTASQVTNPNLQGIQQELGDQLGLNMYHITTLKEEKARLLSDKIKSKEKILTILVLNDLEGGIDLGEIGIPFGNDHKGSKILLIAQTRELLSDQMKTQKQYCVDIDPDRLEREHVKIAAVYSGNLVSELMKTKLDEIEMALKQPSMRIVGVYGSSDARNHVVEPITKRLERDGVFDVVVHVTPSMRKDNAWRLWRQIESPDVKKIQEELANELGVQLPDKTSLVERATLLCDTIKTKGNILIIIYVLKGGIDLGEVGIPFGNDHLASKIMLLAHTKEVFSKSNQRNAPQKVIFVDDA